MNYTLGLYEKAMPNHLSIEEKLQCAKKAGYDYLELSIDATEDKINRIYWSREERQNIIKSMQKTGVGIDSFCVSALTKYALGDLDSNFSERGMEIIKGGLNLAYDLGTRIVMIPGYDIYYGESNQDTEAKYVENLRTIANYAAMLGVCLGFETMENDFMNTVEKARKYVDLIDSPYLQIYPDCGNVTNAMVSYQGNLKEDFRTGKGHMLALHLKETKPGVFREVPYGEGHVEFEKVVEIAYELGIRKYVTEFWDIGKKNWETDLLETSIRMRAILDNVNTIQKYIKITKKIT